MVPRAIGKEAPCLTGCAFGKHAIVFLLRSTPPPVVFFLLLMVVSNYHKPSIHYCIHGLCREPQTLGKGSLALGKTFAESSSRQRPIGTSFIGKEVFVESYSSGSRQRVCREPQPALGKKISRYGVGGLTATLPRAARRALSKEINFVFLKIVFAESLLVALGKEIIFF
jgi:hypothetical protein